MHALLREEVVLLVAILGVAGVTLFAILELLGQMTRRQGRPQPLPRPEPTVVSLPERPIPIGEDPATRAFRVGVKLLVRALEEPDPAAAARRTLLHRATACLARGLEAAPADPRLHDAMAAVREALAPSDRPAVA